MFNRFVSRYKAGHEWRTVMVHHTLAHEPGRRPTATTAPNAAAATWCHTCACMYIMQFAVLISLQRDIAHSQSWSGQAATRWEYTYGSGAAHTCIAGALDRADRLPGSCVFCCRPVLQGCRSAVRRWRRDVVGPNVCQAPLPSTRLSRELPASRHSILRNGCLNESFFIIVRLVALS